MGDSSKRLSQPLRFSKRMKEAIKKKLSWKDTPKSVKIETLLKIPKHVDDETIRWFERAYGKIGKKAREAIQRAWEAAYPFANPPNHRIGFPRMDRCVSAQQRLEKMFPADQLKALSIAREKITEEIIQDMERFRKGAKK